MDLNGNEKNNPSITIEFDDIVINPTNYIITNCGDSDNAMMSWILSASMDGIEFDLIKKHENDFSLANAKLIMKV